jgi:hypothetical protein
MAKPAKRTFQVAFYGPEEAGKETTLRSLHARLPPARTSALVVVRDKVQAGSQTTLFFDHRPEPGDRVEPTLRLRVVKGSEPMSSQAFMSLISCDAVVFVVSADARRRGEHAAAWKAALDHFSTYQVDLQRLPILVQLTKLDLRRGRLRGLPDAPQVQTNPATGEGLDALMEELRRQISDGFSSGRVPGRPTTVPSRKYMERARALSTAAEIATSLRGRNPLGIELSTGPMALNPELGFATLSSLRSLEAAFFTSWNEEVGPEVEAFWAEVTRRKLPFARRDAVAQVLARGRITHREDYETVTDRLGDDRLSPQQQKRLAHLLGAYETAAGGGRRRRRRSA